MFFLKLAWPFVDFFFLWQPKFLINCIKALRHDAFTFESGENYRPQRTFGIGIFLIFNFSFLIFTYILYIYFICL